MVSVFNRRKCVVMGAASRSAIRVVRLAKPPNMEFDFLANQRSVFLYKIGTKVATEKWKNERVCPEARARRRLASVGNILSQRGLRGGVLRPMLVPEGQATKSGAQRSSALRLPRKRPNCRRSKTRAYQEGKHLKA